MTLAFDAAAAIARSNANAQAITMNITTDEPQWYAVEPHAMQQWKAVIHLAMRHFGVFVPGYSTWHENQYGRLRARMRQLMPGTILIWCWNIEQSWQQILSCPGVKRIICVGNRPLVLKDPFINYLRACENAQEAQSIFDSQSAEPRKRRRRRRKSKRARSPDVHVRTEPLDEARKIKILNAGPCVETHAHCM